MANRKLSEIARDVLNNWKNINPAEKPYLQAMLTINSAEPDATYYLEEARDIVIYFLCNATSFRGQDAKRIKAELKKQYNIK